MGQLGKIYKNLKLSLKGIGEKNLQSCYTPEEVVKAIWENIDFGTKKQI